jgi:hypothetical protein
VALTSQTRAPGAILGWTRDAPSPLGRRLQASPRPPRASTDNVGARVPAPVVPVASVAPVPARLVDVRGAARYLSLSPDGIRDLDARGVLKRVRLPGPNGADLRRVLYDVHDLDRLIERMKDGA